MLKKQADVFVQPAFFNYLGLDYLLNQAPA